jgi:hypothetical protein
MVRVIGWACVLVWRAQPSSPPVLAFLSRLEGGHKPSLQPQEGF